MRRSNKRQTTHLGDQDDEEEEAVGVHHTLALLAGATTSEEGNQEDDGSEDDDEDRSVEVLVGEEVQVVLGLNLHVGSESDENQADQSEGEVEDQKERLEKAVTAAVHLAWNEV